MKWSEDVEKSARWARTHSLANGGVPNHLRCNYFDENGQRCILVTDHANEHKPPKVEPAS